MVLIRETCVKACGKFPNCRLPRGSYSSASRPTSLHRPSSRSKIARPHGSGPQREIVGQPESAGQERAFVPAASRRRCPGGGVSAHEAVIRSSRSIACHGANDARILRAAGSPPAASSAAAASSVRRRSTGRKSCVRRRSPLRKRRRGSRRAARATYRPGRESVCSIALTARSSATHAITLECVKCRRGPRTSQMPSSGLCQSRLEKVHQHERSHVPRVFAVVRRP